MELRSLIFHEFRLSKKSIILQAALMLSWTALTWGMLLSSGSNGLSDNEYYRMLDTIVITTALIGAMPLLLDENFKSNVNSGWLNYSYTLPIKPLKRAAARFIRRFSAVFGNALLSICNAAALCAYSSKPFGANYIVWHIIIYAAVILPSLPNNIFILKARSSADMMKRQTHSGIATTALMFAAIIVIYKASGIDFKNLSDSESLFKLPVFTVKDIAWTVPLLLVMTAASFLTAYHSLKSAYSNAGSLKNKNAVIDSQSNLTVKTDGANGLLYKELRQNRLMLILAAIAPILLTAYPFCFSAIGAMTGSTGIDGVFETASNAYIRILMYVTGIFVISGIMSEVFKGDDKKVWAYFIVSSPLGVKGFLYRKYVITLMMNLIYMVSGIFSDTLLMTVNYFVTGRELKTNISSLYISGVFFLMFINALDIPFTVRYGSKKGSIVKMIAMLSICTAATAAFNLLPDNIQTKLTETVISVFNGKGNDNLMLILNLLPYAAFAVFLYSYKIACRVFMKGVNEYDK